MKTMKLLTVIAVSAGLTFGVATQAGAKKHEEQEVNASDVPAAVQKAAEDEAKGAQIVRWEKEGKAYEAIVDKDGKEWGFKFSAKGKFLGKHEEAKEKESGEKS